jgi:predicted HTH transcriptional regulator
MDYTNIILGLIILALLWVVWKSYQHNEADKKEIVLLEKEKNEYEDLGKGLVDYNQKLQEKKKQAKDKILEIFKTKTKVSNNEVVDLLKISDATVVRYLDELEREGKVKQVGKTGKKVFYTL